MSRSSASLMAWKVVLFLAGMALGYYVVGPYLLG